MELRTKIVFLLDDGTVRPVEQHRYALLVGRKAKAPDLAGQRLRVADLYIAEAPSKVLNETYSVLYFDRDGWAFLDAAAAPYRGDAADAFWTPTADERAKIRSSLS